MNDGQQRWQYGSVDSSDEYRALLLWVVRVGAHSAVRTKLSGVLRECPSVYIDEVMSNT